MAIAAPAAAELLLLCHAHCRCSAAPRPLSSSGGGGGGGAVVTLVVSNVHPSTSDNELRAFLSARVKSGSLRSCSVLKKQGVSKEMAFVDVNNSDEAQTLIDSSGMVNAQSGEHRWRS